MKKIKKITLSDKNEQIVSEFEKFKKSTGIRNPDTLRVYVSSVKAVLNLINKDYDKIIKQDIINAFSTDRYADTSLEIMKAKFVHFLKFINKDELIKYIVDIVRATRNHQSVLLGAGPRATQSLLISTRALAAIEGRDFVIPEDVMAMAEPVLGHRLLLRPEFEIEGITMAEVIDNVLKEIDVPR